MCMTNLTVCSAQVDGVMGVLFRRVEPNRDGNILITGVLTTGPHFYLRLLKQLTRAHLPPGRIREQQHD